MKIYAWNMKCAWKNGCPELSWGVIFEGLGVQMMPKGPLAKTMIPVLGLVQTTVWGPLSLNPAALSANEQPYPQPLQRAQPLRHPVLILDQDKPTSCPTTQQMADLIQREC